LDKGKGSESKRGGEVEMLIHLRQGIEVNNPEELIVSYWNKYKRSFAEYDKARLPNDDSFGEDQIREAIRVSNILGAMIPFYDENKVIKPLLHRQFQLEEALRLVPAEVNILDSYEEIPWQSIKQLLESFSAKYLCLARKTKILHKKRPLLMPILDSVLAGKYCDPLLNEQQPVARNEDTRAVKYIQELKKDIDENKEALLELQKGLKNKGYEEYDLSLTRLLDIVIWSHFKTRGVTFDQQTI